MVAFYKALKPNGKSEPHIVLFSPIAFENLNDPNLPDGSAHNPRLEAITEATRKAAADADADAKVQFIDLFHPTLELYKSTAAPLTINGAHLNEHGYRLLGEVITSALSGEKIDSSKVDKELHAAVLDKNLHWHHRYRAVDGNDVWGGNPS